MPELTQDQLRRLRSAAEEIQQVICELEQSKRWEAAAAEPLSRYAAVSQLCGAEAAADDIIVAGEPE
jgi:hypothetical protein